MSSRQLINQLVIDLQKARPQGFIERFISPLVSLSFRWEGTRTRPTEDIINEVRAREDLNPVAGGDVHTVQVNQIALDRLGAYSDNISNNGDGNSEA